jgi:hypothetical protein
MAKFIGFSAPQQVIVQKVYRSSRVALEKAVADIGSERYRRAFAQVMGGGSVQAIKAAEQVLETTLRKMFMRVATLSFTVEFGAGLGANTNAEMEHINGHTLDNVQDLIDAEARTDNPTFPMRLGARFFNLPSISLSEQSQVETFLHELSHHAAATIDDKNGGECYGWTGVTRLKGLGPARAVRNAENVGFLLARYAF